MERRGVIVWCLDREKFPPPVRCGVLSQLWWHCCVYFSYICQINRELVQNVTSCWHSNFEIWSYGIMFVDIFVLSSMNWKRSRNWFMLHMYQSCINYFQSFNLKIIYKSTSIFYLPVGENSIRKILTCTVIYRALWHL